MSTIKTITDIATGNVFTLQAWIDKSQAEQLLPEASGIPLSWDSIVQRISAGSHDKTIVVEVEKLNCEWSAENCNNQDVKSVRVLEPEEGHIFTLDLCNGCVSDHTLAPEIPKGKKPEIYRGSPFS